MNHLRRDKSRLYVVYMFVCYICSAIEVYIHSWLKYIFICHRSIYSFGIEV